MVWVTGIIAVSTVGFEFHNGCQLCTMNNLNGLAIIAPYFATTVAFAVLSWCHFVHRYHCTQELKWILVVVALLFRNLLALITLLRTLYHHQLIQHQWMCCSHQCLGINHMVHFTVDMLHTITGSLQMCINHCFLVLYSTFTLLFSITITANITVCFRCKNKYYKNLQLKKSWLQFTSSI